MPEGKEYYLEKGSVDGVFNEFLGEMEGMLVGAEGAVESTG